MKLHEYGGSVCRRWRGHSSCGSSVAFGAEGSKVASGSYDNTVKLWYVASGACLQTLEGHSDGVKSVSFLQMVLNLRRVH